MYIQYGSVNGVFMKIMLICKRPDCTFPRCEILRNSPGSVFISPFSFLFVLILISALSSHAESFMSEIFISHLGLTLVWGFNHQKQFSEHITASVHLLAADAMTPLLCSSRKGSCVEKALASWFMFRGASVAFECVATPANYAGSTHHLKVTLASAAHIRGHYTHQSVGAYGT